MQNGLAGVKKNIMKRLSDRTSRWDTASAVTSVYVGATGIWWRSGMIASISQMEQGKKEKAMETLNIAIATLTVFDITQATVGPIASELIHQLVRHKGMFPKTYKAFVVYNKDTAQGVMEGSADAALDVIANAKSMKRKLAEFFQES